MELRDSIAMILLREPISALILRTQQVQALPTVNLQERLLEFSEKSRAL